MDSFLIIVHSFGRRLNGSGHLGKTVWGSNGKDQFRDMAACQNYIQSNVIYFHWHLTGLDYKGLLLRKPAKWDRLDIWGNQFGDTITVGTNASVLPLVSIVCNHRNITQNRLCLVFANKWYIIVLWHLTQICIFHLRCICRPLFSKQSMFW